MKKPNAEQDSELVPPLPEPPPETQAVLTAGQVNRLIDSWFKYNIHNTVLAQHGVHYHIIARAVDGLKQAINTL
jgi:hypothetical protein